MYQQGFLPNANAARKAAPDSVALRIVMDRLAPPHKTPAREPYDCGPLDTVNDCVNALRRIATDVASGELPGDHADEIAARIRDQAPEHKQMS